MRGHVELEVVDDHRLDRHKRLASLDAGGDLLRVLIAVEDVERLGQIGLDVRERGLELVHVSRHRVSGRHALNRDARHHRSQP